jgi:hypothetical protein
MRLAALAIAAQVIVGCTAVGSSGACATAGCPVPLRTQPTPHPDYACEASRIGGVLIGDDAYGLAIMGDGGFKGVIWPNGYSARRDSDGIVLLDRSGKIVAREGDRVAMAGVETADHVQHPCYDPDIRIGQ